MICAITAKQIRYIKTLAGKVFGGDDAAYREMLWCQAKVKSCKDLKGALVEVVIRHLERSLGKTPPTPPLEKGGEARKQPRATTQQLDEIRRRWDRLCVAPPWEREGALRKFLQRRFHVNSPEWLTLAEAQKVLNGLKAMMKRGPGAIGQGPVKAEG